MMFSASKKYFFFFFYRRAVLKVLKVSNPVQYSIEGKKQHAKLPIGKKKNTFVRTSKVKKCTVTDFQYTFKAVHLLKQDYSS